MYNQKRNRRLKIICWFCMGIIISLSISAMWVSGTWNPNRFFDVGEIYDFMKNEYRSGWSPGLEEQDGRLTKTSEEKVEKQLVFNRTKCQWNYFYIDIADLNQDNMTWNVSFYRNDEIVQVETLQLKQGGNMFALAAADFNRCRIEIPDQQGISFSITKMQMYEQIPRFNMKMILFRSLLVMIGYVLISFLLLKLKKRKNIKINFYEPVETLQRLFVYFSNQIVLPKTGKMTVKKRRNIRVCLLLFLIIYTSIFDMRGEYYQHFSITVVVGSLCILGIGIVSIERETRILEWRNPLVYGWFTLGSVAVVSEFIVEHGLSGMGMSMVFAFGFLYFSMGNMTHPQQFLEDILQMVKITFWFSTVFCMVCRPYIEGTRYLGASYNPAVFGMYEIIAFVGFLSGVEEHIRNKSNKYSRWLEVCGAVISGYFIWKTQSLTVIVALVIALLIFSYRIFLIRHTHKAYAVRNIGAALLLSIGICFVMGPVLKHIPVWLGTKVTFEKDVYIYAADTDFFGNPVKAQAANRLIDKIKSIGDLEEMSSGRIVYWKDYIRQFNLWGNYGKGIVRAKLENPHNAVIGIGYRYGIFAIIPYVIIILYGLYYSYMEKEKNGKSMLPFTWLLTVLVVAMSDNVEQPFLWISWFIMYFMIGYSFCLAERKGKDIGFAQHNMEISYEKK